MSAAQPRLEPYHCPQCGTKHWLASESSTYEHKPPRPGDLSVCVHCAAVLVFEPDMRLRPCTLGERVAGGSDLELAVGAVLMALQARERK